MKIGLIMCISSFAIILISIFAVLVIGENTPQASTIYYKKSYCDAEDENSYVYNYQNVTDKILQAVKLGKVLERKKTTICFGPNPIGNAMFPHSWTVIQDKEISRNEPLHIETTKMLLFKTVGCKIFPSRSFIRNGFYNCFGSYRCMDIHFEYGFWKLLGLVMKNFIRSIVHSNICIY